MDRRRLLGAMGAVLLLAVLALLTFLAGIVAVLLGIFVLVSVLLFAVWWKSDVLAARLACRAIGRIPQEYVWTMDKIKIRPRLAERDGGYSEVTIVNWTWHNPKGFDDETVPASGAFVLQIDEFRFRLRLRSIWGALKEHKSIEIALMRAEGFRFNTVRNKQGALNLWQALDLPDDDVNVKSFTSQAFKYGGMHEDADPMSSSGSVPNEQAGSAGTSPELVPLPPISTAATRAAAGFWKPEWGPRPVVDSPQGAGSSRGWGFGRGFGGRGGGGGDLEEALLPEKRYIEEPIGDPRRRPRWGVPTRFDILRIHLVDVQLWVLDLMTMDTHSTLQKVDREKTRIDVHSINISRQRLEAGDDRRSGSVDDIHGVYLGELVWVIIAEIIPLVVKRSPGAFSRNAAVATGLAIKDATKRIGAKTVQAAHLLGHNIKECLHYPHPHLHQSAEVSMGALVHLHLIGGRQVTRKERSVNSHAYIELLSSTGASIAAVRSEPQMWTKVPKWDETFQLGPATSTNDVIRVTLYHQKSRQVVGFTTHAKETPERFIGEVVLPIRSLLIRDPVIEDGGEVVGWFQLSDTRGLRHGIHCTGQLKLGVRVSSADGLHNHDGHHQGSDPEHARSDWAILR